jgi:hypothetical protein
LTTGVELADRRAGGVPERLVAGPKRDVLRQRMYFGNAHGDDVGRVSQPVTAIAGGGRPRYPQIVDRELRKQAPLDERPRAVLAGPDVPVADQLADQSATHEVTQHELPRNIADVHRIAAPAGAMRSRQRFRMQPARGLEAVFGNLVDDGLIV